MFNQNELSIFQSDYFDNYFYKNGVVEVQSHNTKHYWKFYKVEMPIQNKIVLFHKYDKYDKYHKQCFLQNVKKVYKAIVEHDAYLLGKSTHLT